MVSFIFVIFIGFILLNLFNNLIRNRKSYDHHIHHHYSSDNGSFIDGGFNGDCGGGDGGGGCD